LSANLSYVILVILSADIAARATEAGSAYSTLCRQHENWLIGPKVSLLLI